MDGAGRVKADREEGCRGKDRVVGEVEEVDRKACMQREGWGGGARLRRWAGREVCRGRDGVVGEG